MIDQLAVILTDVEYKCESCILSPGQEVSNKFMEIDRAISTQKTFGSGGNLNNTIDNPVDQPPPANNANIASGDKGPPSETDVDQQATNPNADPHRAAPIIQQQGVLQLQQRDQRDVQQQPADLGILDPQRPGHHDNRDTAQILDKQQQRHQQQHIGHGLLDQQQRVLTQRDVQQQPADPGSLDRQHAGHHNNRDTTQSLEERLRKLAHYESTQDEHNTNVVCKFYAQANCKYGRKGRGCMYTHPWICQMYLQNGDQGCRGQCDLYHPKLCVASLHYGVCNRVRCFYYHVTGTKRPHLNHRDVNRPSNNGHHNNSDIQRSHSNNQNSENSYYNFNRKGEYDNNHGRQYRSGGRRGHNGGRSEYNYDNQVAQHSLSHGNPEHSSNNIFLDKKVQALAQQLSVVQEQHGTLIQTMQAIQQQLTVQQQQSQVQPVTGPQIYAPHHNQHPQMLPYPTHQ